MTARAGSPYLVLLDQVAIRRRGDHVEIAYPEEPGWCCHLYVGAAGPTLSDQDILDLHNGIVLDRAAAQLTATRGQPALTVCAVDGGWPLTALPRWP